MKRLIPLVIVLAVVMTACGTKAQEPATETNDTTVEESTDLSGDEDLYGDDDFTTDDFSTDDFSEPTDTTTDLTGDTNFDADSESLTFDLDQEAPAQ